MIRYMISAKNGRVYGKLIYDKRTIYSYVGKSVPEVKEKLENTRRVLTHAR